MFPFSRKKTSQQDIILGMTALIFMMLLVAASMIRDAAEARNNRH